MKHAITRFPVLISATFVLITGVVFAQVLPEEPPIESLEEVIVDTPDVVIEPEVVASSTVTFDTDEASSTEEIILEDLGSGSSTEVAVVDTPLVEVLTDESIKNTVFTAADEVNSLRDLERPQQCQTEGAKEFFDTIGECVRFVTAKISESKREPFEDRLNEQPERFLE